MKKLANNRQNNKSKGKETRKKSGQSNGNPVDLGSKEPNNSEAGKNFLDPLKTPLEYLEEDREGFLQPNDTKESGNVETIPSSSVLGNNPSPSYAKKEEEEDHRKFRLIRG